MIKLNINESMYAGKSCVSDTVMWHIVKGLTEWKNWFLPFKEGYSGSEEEKHVNPQWSTIQGLQVYCIIQLVSNVRHINSLLLLLLSLCAFIW